MFITLEGLDGTGKSSAAKLLAEALGFAFTATPDDDYMPIRKTATSNKYSAYHYYLSYCYHVSDLAGSQDIVCDRYIHSTIAYNWPFSYDAPEDIYSFFEGLRKPDKSFLLTAPENVRKARMLERGILSELDGDFSAQSEALKVYMKFTDLIRLDTENINLYDVVKILVLEVKHA